MYRVIIHMFICLIASQFAQGQNNVSISDYSQRIIVSTGIDPSWNVSFAYQRNLRVNKRVITSYGELEASVVRPGIRNWDAYMGAIIPLFAINSFHLLTDPCFSLGRLETRNFDSFSMLLGNEVAAGFFKERKYFSFLIAYNRIIATHISHSDFYREAFFEDAQNGWYRSTGGYFQFGISGGFTLGSKHELFMELKIPLTEEFGGFGGSPAHINLGYGYRIG